MARRLKITVLRRFHPEEVFSEKQLEGKDQTVCDKYEDGQVMYLNEKWEMPEGFCQFAWHALFNEITHLRFGGTYPWFNDQAASINCCTDGLRPVVFKLEVVDM